MSETKWKSEEPVDGTGPYFCGTRKGRNLIQITAPDGRVLFVECRFGPPHENAADDLTQRRAVAAEVVRACNAHDELVAALRRIEKPARAVCGIAHAAGIGQDGQELASRLSELWTATDEARAALAKATVNPDDPDTIKATADAVIESGALDTAAFNASRCRCCGMAAQAEDGGNCQDCQEGKVYGDRLRAADALDGGA
jgi:hypothetical protein